MTSAWFSLRSLILVNQDIRFSPIHLRTNARRFKPLFPSSARLSPSRQPLRIVYEVDGSAFQQARTSYLGSLLIPPFLSVTNDSSGFLTNSSIPPEGVVILVESEAEQADVLGMIGELETEEQRSRLKVLRTEEWYEEEGLEASEVEGSSV